jgi:hypothetical protein
MSWGLIASAFTGGAAAAAASGLLVGAVSRLQRDRRWLRDRQVAGYAAVLDAYTRIEQELRAAHLAARSPAVDWSSLDSTLTLLSLVASQDVADTAAELAQACRTVEQRLPGHSGRWPAHADMLVAAQMAFINAARLSLDRSQAPLRQYAGAHRLTSPSAVRYDARGPTFGSRRPAPATSRPPANSNGNAAALADR